MREGVINIFLPSPIALQGDIEGCSKVFDVNLIDFLRLLLEVAVAVWVFAKDINNKK